jgi:hypothetical protein
MDRGWERRIGADVGAAGRAGGVRGAEGRARGSGKGAKKEGGASEYRLTPLRQTDMKDETIPQPPFAAADVLAGAYRGNGRRGMGPREDRAILIHVVELDASGDPVRVLCGRIPLDHVTVDADDTARAPTCPVCRARLARALTITREEGPAGG